MPAPHGFIEKLATIAQTGQPFVSVTMVEAKGSVPQEAGSKMLVDHNGLIFGTIGGGRVESQAIDFAKALLLEPPTAASTRLVEWNLKRDVGMTCGGTVTLFFESINHRVWDIVIFGAGHVANAISRCLLNLDCRLTVVDSRREWLEKLPESDRLIKVHCDAPEDWVVNLATHTFVLLMTMGHRTDRPILEAILKRDLKLPYLGVIGSKGKRGALKKELLAAGLSESRCEEFRCPIGLPLGSNEPNEIAISVAAELLQIRDRVFAAK